jgi:hypothetical protein
VLDQAGGLRGASQIELAGVAVREIVTELTKEVRDPGTSIEHSGAPNYRQKK